ncbi:MAG: WD40 repeat domain-containing protein, partial [Bdellovibrionales bacterium]|nr:WD40 repeat domain-containing protein [Bdellovibrionales bacterium]
MNKRLLTTKYYVAFAFVLMTSLPAQAADVYVPRNSVGESWGSTEGLTQFRGTPSRSYYGTGPIRDQYQIGWRYPEQPMCAKSDGKRWCGSGWTGQPAVWRRPDGKLEIIVGTYDRAVHFIDYETGKDLRKPFPTGDIIKGSVTIDPNGFPLLYFGSRDNKYRILSLQGQEAKQLWALDAKDGVPETKWNNDWDGNSSVVNDHLVFGGENSWFYTWKLNRGYNGNGQIQVDPKPVVRMRGWNKELLRNVGDNNVSIESSVALYESRAYFTNSGGRVVGIDLDKVDNLEAKIVFDFWMGDDVDASPMVDQDGMLYIAAEYERFLSRAREVGQLVKLNPYRPENPLEWKVDIQDKAQGKGG